MTRADVGGTVESHSKPIANPKRIEVAGESGSRMKAAIASERPK
jgi:hypothetical protein